MRKRAAYLQRVYTAGLVRFLEEVDAGRTKSRSDLGLSIDL